MFEASVTNYRLDRSSTSDSDSLILYYSPTRFVKMTQEPQYYRVSRVWFGMSGNLRDPHVPDSPQFHHAIFVQKDGSGSGDVHHAIGDVTNPHGMRYEKKFRDSIFQSSTYHHEQLLGYIKASSYLQLHAVLQSCQTPPRQKAYNATRDATEPFKTANPFTFYTTDELKYFQFPRLRKCKWWVEDQAIPALQASGLLVPQPPAN
ncbi:hypothetical protein PRK78_001098 [Emydomyces testavorans]|uniref:Uncharacterized protein n=1 Tax=Emydomyces testavorans TaxID=2070801 RepID=A0AAF0DCB4_9EURO|nr:hypothetical protein PRK78_001098 [Emydomyces testavorans]